MERNSFGKFAKNDHIVACIKDAQHTQEPDATIGMHNQVFLIHFC